MDEWMMGSCQLLPTDAGQERGEMRKGEEGSRSGDLMMI